ncbi:hypothetical protein GVN20_03045 [Runella sp. CRIBMP]|nr:hypothetical protein [Runella sp. CRIBMP]NBB18322.1 hypothetical protein [Runella sp. CRIBMP]
MKVKTISKIEKRAMAGLKSKDGKLPFSDKLAKANEILAKTDLSVLKRK